MFFIRMLNARLIWRDHAYQSAKTSTRCFARNPQENPKFFMKGGLVLLNKIGCLLRLCEVLRQTSGNCIVCLPDNHEHHSYRKCGVSMSFSPRKPLCLFPVDVRVAHCHFRHELICPWGLSVFRIHNSKSVRMFVLNFGREESSKMTGFMCMSHVLWMSPKAHVSL